MLFLSFSRDRQSLYLFPDVPILFAFKYDCTFKSHTIIPIWFCRRMSFALAGRKSDLLLKRAFFCFYSIILEIASYTWGLHLCLLILCLLVCLVYPPCPIGSCFVWLWNKLLFSRSSHDAYFSNIDGVFSNRYFGRVVLFCYDVLGFWIS